MKKRSHPQPGAPSENSSGPPPLRPSTLYLVATPIGNLEDITLRALRVLRECDRVAAEDTRRAGRLLKHFELSQPLVSCFQFNEARRTGQILEWLRQGEKIALISDAGTPGISDPGERIVRAVLAAGFRVEPIPGACALVAALAASGLPTNEFHFIGFLPHKPGRRRDRLQSLETVPGTWIFYEAPFRIQRLLEELAEFYPDRLVVMARELTKRFEESLRGTAHELRLATRDRTWKGEFVVLVGPPEKPQKEPATPAAPDCL